MTLHRPAHLLAAFAVFALCGTAQAARPLATEDADVLERGQCEAEGVIAQSKPSGEPSTRGWTAQGACGIGINTQLALAYNRSRTDDADASALLFGGKTAILSREGDGLGLSLAFGLVSAKADTGSMEHELTYLNAVATRELARGWTGHANLGWLRSESASANSTTWNLAVEHALGNGVDLMGEVYGDDRAKPWIGVGARWAVSDKLSLNANWATQRETPRVNAWSIGFKLAF
ncbi:transporter [Rhizobacter sp. AJA081-3]|uniref:transporter n=1 Tax=Rhizobacter sp. AJA081-3 TaxID=2753607 RepID=UPI001AE0AA92|nr:transporter [Rhizobacter sp. AJA081-3]QTN21406.1 transporter [Rhizobacter sp. AJA081-3]